MEEMNFVIYTNANGEVRIEMLVQDKTLWLTKQKIADLFDVERSVVTKHLGNIFDSGELERDSICAKIAQVQHSAYLRFGNSHKANTTVQN